MVYCFAFMTTVVLLRYVPTLYVSLINRYISKQATVSQTLHGKELKQKRQMIILLPQIIHDQLKRFKTNRKIISTEILDTVYTEERRGILNLQGLGKTKYIWECEEDLIMRIGLKERTELRSRSR